MERKSQSPGKRGTSIATPKVLPPRKSSDHPPDQANPQKKKGKTKQTFKNQPKINNPKNQPESPETKQNHQKQDPKSRPKRDPKIHHFPSVKALPFCWQSHRRPPAVVVFFCAGWWQPHGHLGWSLSPKKY